MSNLTNDKRGFSLLEGLVLLVVVGMVGFAGYYVYDRSQDDATQANQTGTSSQTENSTGSSDDGTPEVNGSEDLDAAQQYVEATDVEASLSTSELDAALLDE